MTTEVQLDPELVPLMEMAPDLSLSVEALAELRAARLAAPVELSDAVERTDHIVGDDPPVVVRVHRPRAAGAERLPAVYSIHGGGYVMGTYEMDDARFDRWCPMLGCVGVSVEYRLAPETPYPGPLDDCYAGLRWTFEHADEIGVDTGRVGIAGISAGGGLAAALALLVRDRRELSIGFQLLECPMIDDRQVTPSSCLAGLPIWSKESNEFGWRAYLGEQYGRDDILPYAAAARAADLTGLPPGLVVVGGADGFRDENIDYALRLNQAGVPTELHVLPGAPHGVQLFAASTLANRWNRLVTEWLALQLGRDSLSRE